MDIKKLANIIFNGGIVFLFAAFLWWATFYGAIVKELNGNLSDAFSCFYSSGGVCGIAIGLAQMVGKTPYSPSVFWIGAVGLIIGGLMRSTLKKELLQAGGFNDSQNLDRAYHVSYLAEDGNAASAGVELGDLLIKYNNHQITSDQDLSEAVKSVVGPVTTITVVRGDRCLDFTIKSGHMGIDGYPDTLDANTRSIRMAHSNSHNERKFCPNCGASITKEYAFCGNCGSKL